MAVSGIGYQGMTAESFISRLRLHSVDVVVDVRLNAISRKRGFSKKSLTAALEDEGIAYLHLPALGNERSNRDGYAETESDLATSAREHFRTVLNEDVAVEGLRQVAELSISKRVVVFCFEAEEEHCHREQVIEAVNALLKRGLVTA